jgi:diguanylate cyclase (GGDEF)-like protein
MENPKNPRHESPDSLRSFILQYGCAVVSVALATGIRLLLSPLLGDRSPFLIVLFAVLITAWYAGVRPALVATVLGLLLADYFLIPSRGSFFVHGSDHWAELLLYLVLSVGISILGGKMQAARLVSARNLRQVRESLAQSEDRLGLTLRTSGLAVWRWEIARNVIEGDEQCSVLFGLPPGQFPRTVEEFAALLHPDDRERVQQHLAATIEHGAEYNTEFRVVWRNNSVRSLVSRAKLHCGEGRENELIGVSWDVSESRQAAEQLSHVNEKLTQSIQELERRKERTALLNKMNGLLQACSNSIEAYDIVAQFCEHLFPTYAGGLCIYSASRNLVHGVTTWNNPLIVEGEFEPDDCWALRRGQPYVIDPGKVGIRCRHTTNIEGGHACLPLMAQGRGLGILYLQGHGGAKNVEEFLTSEDRQLADTVAENVAISLSNLYLQETLRHQSLRDPLTGLFNRRYLEESTERELYRLARRGQPAGFAMLDLDHFKTFNDTFGHEGGDALLRAFGQFLREHLRKEDIACRYGGEEFCILFGESSLEDTIRCVEKLRSGVSELTVQIGGQQLGVVTVSIGVASYPIHGSTLTELVVAADTALYKAKADGRNRVVAATARQTAEVVALQA